jgi:hypothetical protein
LDFLVVSLVRLDFFPAHDLNGTSLFTMTEEDDYFMQIELRPELGRLGGGVFTAHRRVGAAMFDNGVFQPEVFVRVNIPQVHATKYIWGFFLDLRKQVLIAEEEGKERFVMGGPGPLFYLSRAVLWDEQFSGSGFAIDRDNGVFDFDGDDNAGQILIRLFNEDIANTLATFLPDLTYDFTGSVDSAGAAWSDTVGSGFSLPIGEPYLAHLWSLQDAITNLDVTVDLGDIGAPTYEMRAWQALGVDRSTSSFAAGKIYLKEGENLESPLEVTGTALRKASHALVRGRDGEWGRSAPYWDPGEYARAVMIDYPNSNSPFWLNRAGERFINRQINVDQEFDLAIRPGFDELNGYYFPGPFGTNGHLWYGDTVTIDTGAATSTPLDFQDEEHRVTGFRMELRDAATDETDELAALSWNIWVNLNHERGSDNGLGSHGDGSGAAVGPHTHPPNPRLCPATVEGSPDTELYHQHFSSGPETVSIYPSGTGQWPITSARWVATPDSDGSGGSIHFTLAGTGGGSPKLPATAAVSYRIDCDSYYGGGLYIEFYNAANTMIQQEQMYAHTSGSVWVARTWTTTAPANTAYMQITTISAGYYDHVRITQLGTGAAASNPLNGTSNRAKRCDSSEHEIAERAPGLTDDESHGYPRRTIWHDELTGLTWISLDDTDGAAVWQLIGGTTETGGQIIIEEEDGSPTGTFDTLKVPNSRLTDNGDGSASLDLAASSHAHGSPAAGFRGVLVQRTTDFTTVNDNDNNPDFDTELYDTDGLWTAGAPERITIPASWDGLHAVFHVHGGFATGTDGFAEFKLYKNVAAGSIGLGNDDKLVGVSQHFPSSSYNTFIELVTPPLQVATGDFFVLAIKTPNTDSAIEYHDISITMGAYLVEPGEGAQGDPGEGVPTGGTAGQVLTKDSGTDFDTSWQDAAEGGARILLADGRSTPFTFNDLLQADDGSDFLWTD